MTYKLEVLFETGPWTNFTHLWTLKGTLQKKDSNRFKINLRRKRLL